MPPLTRRSLLLSAPALTLCASSALATETGDARLRPVADTARVARVLASSSLDEKLAQMLLAYPQRDQDGPVTVGGVLFVGHTLDDIDAARSRIVSTRARARIPPLTAVDLEGGGVNRLQGFPEIGPVPSPLELSQLPDDEVEAWGAKVGRGMRDVGLDVNLAPVLDVAASGHLYDKARTFGGDPAVVVAKGSAFSRGLRNAGVVAIGKHFPGYGDLAADSDHELAVAKWTPEHIQAQVAVFEQVSALSGVMLSNVIYPPFGPKPAILTERLVSLAHDHGWLTVTDDLAIGLLAKAISGTPEDVVRDAFLAGNDLLLTTAPPDWDQGIDYVGVLRRTVGSDPERLDRVDRSVRRILMLKDRMGLLDGV